ncbi:threonine--tRNA ligase [Candidatus Woesearchaeota archaeon CG10_big_fil_rev_8_21_14_0_10_36_11]|nr:MAG: threonine--tRNA ligase [Candidatus Woesearchaeota archaeon CG10_big_fil_rev_8_21_14_0_10_36_11]
MKILTIHADFIEFEAKKRAIKDIGDVEKGKVRAEECLVVFTAVEKRDEKKVDTIVQKYVQEIKNIAQQVNTKTIVLYPYAHLSSMLSSPAIAEDVMKRAETILSEKYKVTRAPFGWYKSFTIACKGHPLSELSREFTVDENTHDTHDTHEMKKEYAADTKSEKKEEQELKQDISEALKAEDTLVSHWYILDCNGELQSITYNKEKQEFNGFDFSNHTNLKKFAAYEMAKSRVAKEEPPHVRLMRKLELVDYEPGSDPGNLRYYPKGRLIKGLIERYVTQKVKEYGAMEIEAPIMYDYEHPALKSYLHRFPARQYAIQTPNKKVFLRFAACFGQFLEMHDAQISYKHLPVRLYEMTRYSFRVEQHGELTGLRRLRAFTMPDTHAFCSNLQQANEEMMKRVEMSWQVQEGIGLDMKHDLEFAIRITRDMWDKNQDYVKSLVKRFGKPTLVEMWDKRFFYFSMKYEWNFVDALDKCSTLTTDQLDVENAERYDITYVDKESKKQFPLILHCSPSGAVERVMFALLERAAMSEIAGKVPELPLWLAPTQVRLIPVSVETHGDFCTKVAERLDTAEVRVDIDDREESVGKRIRASGQEWTPYTLVIGDKEVEGNQFSVRVRGKENDIMMSFDDIVEQIKEKTKNRPYDTLPLPRLLSKRIIFVG